jgi:hypothetical protein
MATKINHQVKAKKLDTELKKAKKTITELKKDLKNTLKDLKIIVEEAYVFGYSEALHDMDKKSDALDKHLEKALLQFEKGYGKKATKKTTKKATKKPTKTKKRK